MLEGPEPAQGNERDGEEDEGRRDLDLRRPIYTKTAAYGHFGRDDHDFTWERVDKADALREAAGLAPATAGV